jgi:CheY-like chemotaxis protein
VAQQVIYIVEDNIDFFDVILDFLKDEFIVKHFESPKLALELMEQKVPDIIITDIKIPEMDGIEFMEALRARHFHMPVIAISAYITPAYLVRAFELGIIDFLEKPLSFERFRAALKRALRVNALAKVRLQLSEQVSSFFQMSKGLIDNFQSRYTLVEDELFNSKVPQLKEPDVVRAYLKLIFEGHKLQKKFEFSGGEIGSLLNVLDQVISSTALPNMPQEEEQVLLAMANEIVAKD